MRETGRSTLFGWGVFSSIRIWDGKPFLWDKHWRRLVDNAARVDIDLSEQTEENVRRELDELVEVSNIVYGRVRITLADDSPSEMWATLDEKKTRLSMITGNLRSVSENFRLAISPHLVNSTSPLAGIKSCNYLDRLLALEEAKARAFDEAIQINERGEITSPALANVFWVKDNILFTPSLKTGCLAGTTREFIMENLDCREVKETLDTLYSAEAIFLTSAGLGVVQVAEFETRKLSRVDHPILDLLPKFP